MDEEHKKRIGLSNSISLKGKHCSKKTEFKKGMIPWNKGKKCPQLSKENHANWKGGISRDYCYKVFEDSRKEKVCVCCKEKDLNKLLIHHCDGNEKNNDIRNLSCVCNYCHNAMHDTPNKKKNRFKVGHKVSKEIRNKISNTKRGIN